MTETQTETQTARRPVTYAEPVIAEAARQAKDSAAELVQMIASGNLFQAEISQRNVAYWLSEVRRMRHANHRAYGLNLYRSYHAGRITVDELHSELLALDTVTNRITQD